MAVAGKTRVMCESSRTISNTDQWKQVGENIDGEGKDDRFGVSVALSRDGTIVAAGAIYNDGNGLDSGHIRVFRTPE